MAVEVFSTTAHSGGAKGKGRWNIVGRLFRSWGSKANGMSTHSRQWPPTGSPPAPAAVARRVLIRRGGVRRRRSPSAAAALMCAPCTLVVNFAACSCLCPATNCGPDAPGSGRKEPLGDGTPVSAPSGLRSKGDLGPEEFAVTQRQEHDPRSRQCGNTRSGALCNATFSAGFSPVRPSDRSRSARAVSPRKLAPAIRSAPQRGEPIMPTTDEHAEKTAVDSHGVSAHRSEKRDRRTAAPDHRVAGSSVLSAR